MTTIRKGFTPEPPRSTRARVSAYPWAHLKPGETSDPIPLSELPRITHTVRARNYKYKTGLVIVVEPGRHFTIIRPL